MVTVQEPVEFFLKNPDFYLLNSVQISITSLLKSDKINGRIDVMIEIVVYIGVAEGS